MKTRTNDRIRRVEARLDVIPLREDVLEKSYQHFVKTGELPEQRRLAAEVVKQILCGKPKSIPPLTDENFEEWSADLSEFTARLRENANRERPPSVRKHL